MVGIIKRNWRSRGYAGSLQPPKDGQSRAGATNWLVVPVERRFPFIRIQTRQVGPVPVGVLPIFFHQACWPGQ